MTQNTFYLNYFKIFYNYFRSLKIQVMPTNSELSGNEVPGFKVPPIIDNSDGWGPNHLPEQFKDLPYQKFSKSDRIGKVSSNKQTPFFAFFSKSVTRSLIGLVKQLAMWTRSTINTCHNFQ